MKKFFSGLLLIICAIALLSSVFYLIDSEVPAAISPEQVRDEARKNYVNPSVGYRNYTIKSLPNSLFGSQVELEATDDTSTVVVVDATTLQKAIAESCYREDASLTIFVKEESEVDDPENIEEWLRFQPQNCKDYY